MRAVFDGDIEHLVGKLKELRKSLKVKEFGARNCSNFDEQVTVLQRRLKKLGSTSSSKDKHLNEIRKIAEASLSVDFNWGEDENEIPDHDHDHKVISALCFLLILSEVILFSGYSNWAA